MSVLKKWPNEETGNRVRWFCPGCECSHIVPVNPHANGWEWNGSLDKPTLSPSILCTGTVPITADEHKRIMGGETIKPVPTCCHSFMRDGRIEFLGDCTHALAGSTIDMVDLDDPDQPL